MDKDVCLMSNKDSILCIFSGKKIQNTKMSTFVFKDWEGFQNPDKSQSFFFNYRSGFFLKMDSSIYLIVTSPDYKKMVIEIVNFGLSVGDTINARQYLLVDKFEKRDYKIHLVAKIKTSYESPTYLFSLYNYCSPKSIVMNIWINPSIGIEGLFYSLGDKKHIFSGVGNYHKDILVRLGYLDDNFKQRNYDFSD